MVWTAHGSGIADPEHGTKEGPTWRTPAEKKTVRAAVKKRFPSIGKKKT